MSISERTVGAAIAALLVTAIGFSNSSVKREHLTKGLSSAAANVTIYRNGRIYTNDAASPWAEAMLVRGEEIIAVGDDDEVSGLADKGAQVIDLEKHFVMPGFNDAHVHIGSAG